MLLLHFYGKMKDAIIAWSNRKLDVPRSIILGTEKHYGDRKHQEDSKNIKAYDKSFLLS